MSYFFKKRFFPFLAFIVFFSLLCGILFIVWLREIESFQNLLDTALDDYSVSYSDRDISKNLLQNKVTLKNVNCVIFPFYNTSIMLDEVVLEKKAFSDFIKVSFGKKASISLNYPEENDEIYTNYPDSLIEIVSIVKDFSVTCDTKLQNQDHDSNLVLKNYKMQDFRIENYAFECNVSHYVFDLLLNMILKSNLDEDNAEQLQHFNAIIENSQIHIDFENNMKMQSIKKGNFAKILVQSPHNIFKIIDKDSNKSLTMAMDMNLDINSLAGTINYFDIQIKLNGVKSFKVADTINEQYKDKRLALIKLLNEYEIDGEEDSYVLHFYEKENLYYLNDKLFDSSERKKFQNFFSLK
ncbi:hypothetical protein GUI12_03815 [Anaplasmataceae bacterium AB001_6]|nr:hypothetical protein GUI12_03815 [Anaplasmataceae bacterium AB001_6]